MNDSPKPVRVRTRPTTIDNGPLTVPGHVTKPVKKDFVGVPLAPLLDAWNVMARDDKEVFSEVRRCIEDRVRNEALKVLPPEQFTILAFIVYRTFPFNKYAERISERTFIKGVVNHRNGQRVVAGLHMVRDTLRKHLAILVKKGWVQRWEVEHGNEVFHCYMPLTELHLIHTIIVSGGSLPHPPIRRDDGTMMEPAFCFEEIILFEGGDCWPVGEKGELNAGELVRYKAGVTWGPVVVRRMDEHGHDRRGAENLIVVRGTDCRAITPQERRENLEVKPKEGVRIIEFPADDEELKAVEAAEARCQKTIPTPDDDDGGGTGA